MTTATPQLPLRFGRVRVREVAETGAPDLNDPAVVESLLADAKKVAREESAHRRRLAWLTGRR